MTQASLPESRTRIASLAAPTPDCKSRGRQVPKCTDIKTRCKTLNQERESKTTWFWTTWTSLWCLVIRWSYFVARNNARPASEMMRTCFALLHLMAIVPPPTSDTFSQSMWLLIWTTKLAAIHIIITSSHSSFTDKPRCNHSEREKVCRCKSQA